MWRTKFLTPHAFWNISDFGAKCEKCETINTITLEEGELKKRYSHNLYRGFYPYYSKLNYFLIFIIISLKFFAL
jgi:hypothetical protein